MLLNQDFFQSLFIQNILINNIPLAKTVHKIKTTALKQVSQFKIFIS